MDRSTCLSTIDRHIDLFGQHPRMAIYTQIALVYPVHDNNAKQEIVGILAIGVQRLSNSFPWIFQGGVVCEGASTDNSGTFRIKHAPCVQPLAVKDYRHKLSMPTMSDLRAARFPFRMLDEGLIAPRNTIPGTAGEVVPATSPCFLVQANFISGGLILTFAAQHQVMDIIGQEQVMALFCKACRAEDLTKEELVLGNMAPANLVSGLDGAGGKGPRAPDQIGEFDREGPEMEASPPADCSWTYFSFSQQDLVALKQKALATISQPALAFISTDDALTAFIWKSIMKARLMRLRTGDRVCKFLRAVDVRRHLGLPAKYPGLILNLTNHESTVEDVVSDPLGVVASRLRLAIASETSTLEHDTLNLLCALNRAKNKDKVSYVPSLNPGIDCTLSSWVKMDCTNMDFGLGLGGPEAVRRPQFVPYEGLCYLLPRAKNGEIVLAVCLRDEDIETMSKDEELLRYSSPIA